MSCNFIGTGKYKYRVGYTLLYKILDLCDIYYGILLIKADNKKQTRKIAEEYILKKLKNNTNIVLTRLTIHDRMTMKINNNRELYLIQRTIEWLNSKEGNIMEDICQEKK